MLYPLYFLNRLINKITKNRILSIIMVLFSFCLMFVKFDEFISNLLTEYGGRFSYYSTWGAEAYLKYDLSWQMILVLISKLLLSIWIIYNKKKFIKSKEQIIIFNLFYLSLLLLFPLSPMLIFRRLLYPINILEIFVYSFFVMHMKKAKLVLIIFSILYFLANLYSGFSQPLPYHLRIF
ncbi:EpsG family protein [Peribacillus muralis]|uniref:EpsG family protein n=1 Tax=Peribacillus muralis TaxID=264697 RepID=UPI00366A9763